MSPRARITTLNLGSQSIELAEFRAQPQGGLILSGYRSRDLLADPAREATRPPRVAFKAPAAAAAGAARVFSVGWSRRDQQ